MVITLDPELETGDDRAVASVGADVGLLGLSVDHGDRRRRRRDVEAQRCRRRRRPRQRGGRRHARRFRRVNLEHPARAVAGGRAVVRRWPHVRRIQAARVECDRAASTDLQIAPRARRAKTEDQEHGDRPGA